MDGAVEVRAAVPGSEETQALFGAPLKVGEAIGFELQLDGHDILAGLFAVAFAGSHPDDFLSN